MSALGLSNRKNRKKRVSLAVDEQSTPVMIPDLDESEGKNKYYLRVSRTFGYLRYLTLALLVIYILFMVTAFGDDITVSNLTYLFRDISGDSSSGELFSGVAYTAEPIQRFGIYNGELAYVTGSSVKLFSTSGSEGLSTSISYEDPVIVSTDKYLLVYDVGGYSYSVYSSFATIERESFDYAIAAADMADDGTYLVAVGDRDYKCVVYLYDDFELAAKYSKTNYVTDAAISSDATRICLSTVTDVSGSFVSAVCFYAVGEEDEINECEIDDFPIAVERTDEGFAVLGISGIYFFDSDGNATGAYEYDGELSTYDVLGEYAVLVFPENALGNENRIIVLDLSGNICYNAVIEEKLTDIVLSGYGGIYILSQTRAIMIDVASEEERASEISSSAKKILSTGEYTALVCCSADAQSIDFLSLSSLTGDEN